MLRSEKSIDVDAQPARDSGNRYVAQARAEPGRGRAGCRQRRDQPPLAYDGWSMTGDKVMRGILMWLIGIPIPIIILLYLFNVF
jgi:hypothetical protein